MRVVRWTCDMIRMTVDRPQSYYEFLTKNNWKTSFVRTVKSRRPQRLLLKLSDGGDWGNLSRRRKSWNPVCAMQLELFVSQEVATRQLECFRHCELPRMMNCSMWNVC